MTFAPPHDGLTTHPTSRRIRPVSPGLVNKLEIESVESSKSGNLGFARGTWRMKDASGKILDEGKWIEVRKMVDGQWQIHRDIWNSDRPLPPR